LPGAPVTLVLYSPLAAREASSPGPLLAPLARAAAGHQGCPRSLAACLEQVEDQSDQQFLLPGVALGDQQGRGHQGVVGEQRGAVGLGQQTIAIQVEQEQEAADALVAVGEGMILDDEVEQVRGP